MDLSKIRIESAPEFDGPGFQNGYPVAFFGADPDGRQYWLTSPDDSFTPKQHAEFFMSLAQRIKDLEQELIEEKNRTNVLNFGQ
jgi:hypothetical protein